MAKIDEALVLVSRAVGMGEGTLEERQQRDLALVGAGQALCEALRGFDDGFWAALKSRFPGRTPERSPLDEPGHVHAVIVPRCTELLFRCGVVPREAAEALMNKMVASYAQARSANVIDRAQLVEKARIHMGLLADRVCSQVQVFREELVLRTELEAEQRARLMKILKGAGKFLAGLLLILAPLVGMVDDLGSIHDRFHQAPEIRPAISSIQEMSPEGRDAVLELGLCQMGGEGQDPR